MNDTHDTVGENVQIKRQNRSLTVSKNSIQ